MKNSSLLDSITQFIESHNISHYFFPLLPFLVLVPNFFIIPSLSYPGLATQEMVFAFAAALAVALTASYMWRNRNSLFISARSAKLFTPLLLYFLWQAASLLWAPDRAEALRVLGLHFGFVVFSASSWWLLKERVAWWIYYSLVLLTSVLAISLWLEYRAYGAYEMQGIFFNHGITAEILATLWPLFFCVFLFEKQDRLALYSAIYGMVISFGALMLTLRRGALLGAILAAAIVMGSIFVGKMKVAHRLRMVFVIFSLLFFVLPLVVIKRDAILTRVRGITQLQEASNSQSVELGLTGRAIIWLTAWEMGKNNWLKGVGIGGYSSRYADYRRAVSENPTYSEIARVAETEDYDQIRGPFAHSEVLQTFSELGIIGTLLYLLFGLQAAWRCWQFRKTRYGYLAFGCLASLIAYSVSAATNAFAFRQSPSVIVVASILAMGWTVREKVLDPPESETPGLVKPSVAIAVLVCALLGSFLLVKRNYSVYTSQSIHGSTNLQNVLDFNFALDNEATNEASIRRYQRVLASDPYNVGAHLGLSVLLFQMKRLPECLEYAEFAFSHGYNRPYTFLLRAFANEHNGDPSKAQEILRSGLASYPKSFILRAAYAESLRRRGQRDEAQAQMAIIEKRDEKLAKSWALAMRYKDDEATQLAKESNLFAPSELKPELARVLTQARAYHYYRSIVITP